MNKYNKSLKLFEKYFTETPIRIKILISRKCREIILDEEIQATFDKIDKELHKEQMIKRIIYRVANEWLHWLFIGFVVLGLIIIGFGLGFLLAILIF